MLAVWLPLPMGAGRGLALPVLFRRCRRRKRDGTTDITQGQTRICTGPARRSRGVPARAAEAVPTAAPRPTKPALARALGGIVAGWAAARPVPVVADRLSTGRTCLDDRPAHGHLISRLRMDAALGTPPPKRRAGERGRPRRRGVRLPTPAALTTTSRHWQAVAVTRYGRPVTAQLFGCRALWYVALRQQPVPIVIVRDPRRRRADEAFFCTDLTLDAAAILATYARRWTLEVTFHDAKQHRGFEDPQHQTIQAVRQTAPLAGLVSGLVWLWSAARVQKDVPPRWVQRPWYPAKVAPSFSDLLTARR